MAVWDPAAHAYPAVHGPLQALLVCCVAFPNRPAGHGSHPPALAALNVPAGQTAADVAPDTQKWPAGQAAVHKEVPIPLVDPYRPAGHDLHTESPPSVYFPAGQTEAVAVVEPAAHAYPALHAPLQEDDAMPVVDPKRPEAHEVHAVSPPPLYFPAGHSVWAEGVAHEYPAAQATHDADDDCPELLLIFPGPHVGLVPSPGQYVPATHAAVVHADDAVARTLTVQRPAAQSVQDAAPALDQVPKGQSTSMVRINRTRLPGFAPLQYRPATQAVQAVPPVTLVRPAAHAAQSPAPAAEYEPDSQLTQASLKSLLCFPAGQRNAVAVVEPGTSHAYPAMHAPLQLLEVSPATLP